MRNYNTRVAYKFAKKLFNTIEAKRDHEANIEKYFVILSEKDTPPISIRTQLGTVKSYLLDNNFELRQHFCRKLNRRIKGKKARIQDEVLENNVTLKQIMNQTGTKIAIFGSVHTYFHTLKNFVPEQAFSKQRIMSKLR